MLACAVCFVGFVVGIIVGAVSENNAERVDIIIKIQAGDFNLGGFFFSNLVFALVCLVIIYLNIFSKWLALLSLAAIFYSGYRIGVLLGQAFSQHFFSALICSLLVYLPMLIAVCIGQAVVFCICREQACYCISVKTVKETAVKAAIIFAVIFAVFLVFLLIVPAIIRAFIGV